MRTYTANIKGRSYVFKRNNDDTITPSDAETGEVFPQLRKKTDNALWKVQSESGVRSLSWIVNYWIRAMNPDFTERGNIAAVSAANHGSQASSDCQNQSAAALIKPIVEAVMMNCQVLLALINSIQKERP